VVEQKLATYQGSLNDDVERIKTVSPGRLKTAIELRMAEKRMLMDLKAQLLEDATSAPASMPETEDQLQKPSNSKPKKSKKRPAGKEGAKPNKKAKQVAKVVEGASSGATTVRVVGQEPAGKGGKGGKGAPSARPRHQPAMLE